MNAFGLAILLMFSLSCETVILGPEAAPPLPTLHQSALATLLDSLRYALDLPALAGAIVTDTGIVDAQAVGCRRYGGAANVTINDCFQLGSCTKSFTAVLLGTLVDEGRVTWTTTLPEIFPEYASSMRSEFRNVSVRDLLSHSAGFMRDPNLTLHTKTPMEQRVEVVAWAVTQPPAQTRGRYLYSNLGYVIAGAIAEKLTGLTYEELIMERVIGPLGLTTAGVGQMGTPGLEDQPLQHTPDHGAIMPTADAHLPDIYNPAGILHMSVGDWGKYVQWVLACEAGHATLLRPETAKAITTPVVSTGYGSSYALGWGVGPAQEWCGSKSLQHSGSNGYNYCTAALAPGRHYGVIVMSNQGAVGNDSPTLPAINRLITFHLSGH